MTNQRPTSIIAMLLMTSAFVTACGSSNGALGGVPVPSVAPDASVALGSPDLPPASAAGATNAAGSLSGSAAPGDSTNSGGSPSGTMVVRAYLWLGGTPGSQGLVAVLREVSSTKAVASAAVTALLAGPTTAELGRSITTSIPAGSQLLGLAIVGGVATIDLSTEFESGGGSASVLTRLGQIVYTLTQFPTVTSVVFQIEGVTKTVFSSAGVILDKPATRDDYIAQLPDIWLDRPAFNAAIGNPAHVTGSAAVFEATFRVAILDGSGISLADQQVVASCGSGCRGTFDLTIPYTMAKAQYGIVRVYNMSARDGSLQSVRDYRVWLTPKG